MPQSPRKGARRRAVSRWCPTSTGSAAVIQLPRPGRAAPAEHGRRSESAARPGLAQPVEGRGSERARRALAYHHEAGEWPWAYEARQEFALDEAGLSIRLSCRNVSPTRCRAALGSIPISRAGRRPGSTPASAHAWTIDEQGPAGRKGAGGGPLRSARSAGLRPGPRQRLRRLGRRGADERPRVAVYGSGSPRPMPASSSSTRPRRATSSSPSR